MTVEQKVDQLDRDLAAVRQLLLSAATYAESANRGINRVGEKLDQAVSRQDATDAKLDRLTEKVDEIADAQFQSQTQLNQLTESQSQLNQRVDQFVYHAQRLFTQIGTKLENVEGQSERLEALVQRLDRNHENQRAHLQEFQRTTSATLERIDRVLDYLVGQSGNSGS